MVYLVNVLVNASMMKESMAVVEEYLFHDDTYYSAFHQFKQRRHRPPLKKRRLERRERESKTYVTVRPACT